ncbi:FadR/GntR family transcriptional regulator [Planococcus lenghuensis]|nr:GntR family transcriptional regulator [Planococcus lenghuensis]
MKQPKRFLDIVTEIRNMTHKQNIRPGEWLPSERELAETLQVGRSTIREALRSLELLGLIETRQGEGTFLSDFRDHTLVEVLATFVLQDEQSHEDVRKTRLIHELAALGDVCSNNALTGLPVWKGLRAKLEAVEPLQRETVVRELLIVSGNRLSLKIWLLLCQYSGQPFTGNVNETERAILLDLLAAIAAGRQKEAEVSYIKWHELIEGGDNHDYS